MAELPLTRENVERLQRLTNYAVLNPFKLPLSPNMLQGYGHLEHAECVAAQERIVQYFYAKLEEFLPQQLPMDFEEWEAVVQEAANRALDSTEASIAFLLTPRGLECPPHATIRNHFDGGRTVCVSGERSNGRAWANSRRHEQPGAEVRSKGGAGSRCWQPQSHCRRRVFVQPVQWSGISPPPFRKASLLTE